MMRTLALALGCAITLGVPAVVATTSYTEPVSCHLVAPSLDDGGALVGEYEGGRWVSPEGTVLGWSTAEDAAVWSTEACASTGGAS